MTAGPLLAAALAVPALALPATASASHSQITIVQDGSLMTANPTGTLTQMRALGATTVRVVLSWNSVAPKIEATKRPHFDASSPGAYPASGWNLYDTIVRAAAADGMTVDMTVAGGAPRWSEGPGIPRNWIIAHNPNAINFAWKPSAKDFGQFMHAVGERYSGHFTPKGASSPLPRVRFWSIWNEPNFGQDLAPQATDTSRISYAPMLYRNLIRSGYSALSATGHKRDTILIGEYAAHGYALSMGRHGKSYPQGFPGWGAQTQPLPFTRTLYCLDQQGHRLTGTAARQVGCTGSARAFRKANPGLFQSTGVGDHPYANKATPRSDGIGNKEWSTFPNLPLLEHTFDQANRVYGSHKRYPIYNDEYGYITRPPSTNKTSSVTIATAATYLNEAEYISYNQPRVASYDQYLLNDPVELPGSHGSPFSTGLYTSAGKPKATLNAFRMPLWLPSATLHHAGRAKVWGEARPAYWTGRDTKRTQTVQVQFRARGKHTWTTVDTVHADHYFVVRPRFATSGTVRLRYTYPTATDSLLPTSVAGTTIVSRSAPITVK